MILSEFDTGRIVNVSVQVDGADDEGVGLLIQERAFGVDFVKHKFFTILE